MSDAVQDTSALAQFERAFATYQIWAGREQGPLVEDRGRKVRLELYKQFRALAKPREQLAAALKSVAANKGLKRRPDPRPDVQLAAQAAGGVALLSTEEEIKARIRSVRFLSVSFIIRGWRAATEGQTGRFSARSRSQAEIGAALVRTAKGNPTPFVSLTSLLEGAVIQNSRRQIADRALLAQAGDMADYVARKHREKLASIFRAPFEAAVSA